MLNKLFLKLDEETVRELIAGWFLAIRFLITTAELVDQPAFFWLNSKILVENYSFLSTPPRASATINSAKVVADCGLANCLLF